MVAIFIRTVLIYLLLIGCMRLMGKRQICELEISELVATLIISELAALPITNHEIPIMFAVIPIITIMALETIMSVVLIKFPALKNLLSSRPNVIIEKGVLNQKELKKLRMSNDELIYELRQAGAASVSEVYYAIVEENGKLTVILRSGSKQPTTSQLGLTVQETGIVHILVSDGHIDKHGMKCAGVDDKSLNSFLKSNQCSIKDVFLLLCDDAGELSLFKKEQKQ